MRGVIGWLLLVGLFGMVAGCGGGGPSDTTPPTISDVQVNPSSLIEPDRQVTVQAKVTDNRSGVQSVVARVSYPDGATEEKAMERQQADQSKYSVTFTARWDTDKVGADPTQWFVRVTVQARDRAGNQAQSPESRVRAAAGPPLPPF